MRSWTGWIDRAAMQIAVAGQGRSRAQSMSPAERLAALAELEEQYARPDWLADPDVFFGTPQPCQPGFRPKGHQQGREVLDLSWSSEHRAFDPEVGASYARFEHNTRVHARWYKTPRPRSTVIAIHGYGGGNFRREALRFPVRRWLGRGLDVVLFALPFHGDRRAPGDKLRFPSALPAVTIEGFRQAIGELRELVGLLLDEGVPTVMTVGMSLGGYTAALLATVDDRLGFAMPLVPVASLADYARIHGRIDGTSEEQRQQADALDQVYSAISPLARPSKLPPERVLVAGGEFDRVCPIEHAERLAEHFGCQVVRFRGAHLVQLGRRRAWKAMEARLESLGVA